MDLSTLMPQQRDIVTTLDRPLFVSAGAGSGKTFTLTRRILWALSPESGPFVEHLDQVLAITFTTDAAAEIRERVRAALIEVGMEREALGVDDAWISTIHHMCSRILRAHALELGIDPEFSMIEGAAADALLEQAIDRVLARMESEDARREGSPYAELLQWYPARAEVTPTGNETGMSIRSLVRRLLEVSAPLSNGLDDVRILRGSLDMSSLADAYRPCLGASAGATATATAALEAIERFEASDRTLSDVVACMVACKMPRASKAFPKEQVALLKAEAADTFVNAIAACGDCATRELVDLAHAVEHEYRTLKDAASVLDNNDLLRMTQQAFRQHESIRKAYAGRFKLVMIDEFQDTDQQQIDLISYLTGEGGRALCTVGDAQQSIYRFRGADVSVFRRQEQRIAEASEQDGARVVKLVRNFRSHAEILEYVARVFDGYDGGLMRDFLDLEPHDGRRDALAAAGASRRQALLVAGGSRDERAVAKAAAIARRFRALADAGQPVGDMVVLLGRMTNASVYADALRAQGLDCVIAGGSVFSRAQEVQAVRALVRALANPADTSEGLAPLLASPMFALGVQEFLALATTYDAATGETRRRNLDAGIMARDDAPGLEHLSLVDRARQVLGFAFSRVGRDSFSQIARDAIDASGWFVRLAQAGPEGRAQAANILKALDAVADAETRLGNAPRQIALAFEAFLLGKQAPGALNESASAAVRIMTVHASKGLEFPIVAVADCYTVRSNTDPVQIRRAPSAVELLALPSRLGDVHVDGEFVSADDATKYYKKLLGGSAPWLDASLTDDVCATGSAAEAYLQMREEDRAASLEECSRLLYVAMTRARELLILALDAGASKTSALSLDPERDLTPAVLDRILPNGLDELSSDRLVFESSAPGDFELITLGDVTWGGVTYAAPAAEEAAPAFGPDDTDPDATDTFTLAYPEHVYLSVAPSVPQARDSYSYSSMSAALHEEGEDRVAVRALDFGDDEFASEPDEAGDGAGALASADNDPFALGSAFHAAAQWLIEASAATAPAGRVDALARFWGVSPSQRTRLDRALARWEHSDVRAELLSWPLVRAEVPFFSLGIDDADIRSDFGTFAEGAIDALGTDPADPSRALVIDYKTGGDASEDDATLQRKHALQARVYADVLHRAGYASVTLKFVRVEIPDPHDPEQPQVVEYVFDA